MRSALLAVCCAACAGGPAPSPPPPAPRFSADGRWVRDEAGRAVLLRGINVSGASKHPDPATGRFVPSWLGDDDWARIAGWGFNSVRFLVTWEAAEPRRGEIDNAYLDEVAAAVEAAGRHGLLVVIDMHQDLYNRRFGGNGTPGWAVRDDGIPFVQRDPWWMNYLEPAVRAAYDAFWQDREGIQSRLVATWAAFAERFRGVPNVVGFDLLNEPFPGNEFDLAAFDERRLGPFHAQAAAAIREVDPDRLVFFEPNPVRTNVLAADGFPQAVGAPGGGAVFAPHYYDPPVTQTDRWDGDVARLEAAVDALVAEGARLGVPVWVGEWGLLLSTESGAALLAEHLRIFDAHMLGWALWDYDPGTGMSPVGADGAEVDWFAQELVRAYPARTAGTPESIAWDAATRTLELSFRDRSGSAGPTEIAVPARLFPNGAEVEAPSDPPGSLSVEPDPGPAGAVLRIGTAPCECVHRLIVRPR